MYIDFKETIWGRMQVPEGLESQVSQMIARGNSPEDIYEFLTTNECGTYEYLFDTSVFMTPVDNEGDPTIEIYDDSNNCFLTNKKKTLNDLAVVGINKGLERCNGYCPCVKNSIGKEEYKCPCKKFREEGECCCNLYIKKE